MTDELKQAVERLHASMEPGKLDYEDKYLIAKVRTSDLCAVLAALEEAEAQVAKLRDLCFLLKVGNNWNEEDDRLLERANK